MLDTNTVIYLMKHRPPSVAENVNALASDSELCMSFVTYAELLKGAERSNRKPEVLRRIDGLTQQVPVLQQASRDMCRHYAVQAVRLREAGMPIGGNDLWIASHALAESCVLVTNNEREFSRIDGLRVENWVN